MAMRRPEFADFDHNDTNTPASAINSPRSLHLDMPSPRVGEIPPALSPLDAFAQQSRILARRFEESHQLGRRISRLEHKEVASQLQKKPIYFRSPLDELEDSDPVMPDESFNADLPLLQPRGPPTTRQKHQPPQAQNSQHQQHRLIDRSWQPPPLPHHHHQHQQSLPMRNIENRPNSHYPHHSDSSTIDAAIVIPRRSQDSQDRPGPGNSDSYFGFQGRRANSPEPLDAPLQPRKTDWSPRLPSLTGSADSVRSSTLRTNTDDSINQSQRLDNGLAPPGARSARFPRSPRSNVSIRSVMDGVDDDAAQRTSNELAPPRKISNGSVISGRKSPLGLDIHGHTPRSPSNTSDTSAESGQYRAPSFNFSRPLSSGSAKQWSDGRPSLSSRPSRESNNSFEFPPRKPSVEKARSPLCQESASTKQYSRDHPRNDDVPDDHEDISTPCFDEPPAGAPSYIYSKYALPRGRAVDRSSADPRESWMKHSFSQDNTADMRPQDPALKHPMSATNDRGRPQQAFDLGKGRSRSVDAQLPATPMMHNFHKAHPSSPSVTSSTTDRTVRALHTRNSPSEEIVNMTPEQHLEEGIQCHISGSLSKSTYHLRLAAKAGLPTAMLLYALACRHGWGMRPSQQEAIVWLKKAVDSASLDLISNDNAIYKATDSTSKRDANFSLAVYELGMSYMNGWGIPKDKSLALRCFEIAGNWGDCDALAEAGFCYTQGVGCKKDLKKAARYYRKAADMGMSMAGNSWIYKEKYLDPPVAVPDSPQTQQQPSVSSTAPVSRTRGKSFFGRKNKTVATS